MFRRKYKKRDNWNVSDDEKNTLIEAMQLPGAELDPLIRLNYVYCLAELLSQNQSGIQFGSKFFTKTGALKFIHVEARLMKI